jgi:hypothetical protein
MWDTRCPGAQSPPARARCGCWVQPPEHRFVKEVGQGLEQVEQSDDDDKVSRFLRMRCGTRHAFVVLVAS